jgi:hypothetical protein
MQTLMLEPRERSRDMSLLAVQTVELLKARLATLTVPDAERAAEPPGEPETSPPKPETELERKPELAAPSRSSAEATLSAGIGILSDFAGVGSSWTPVLRGGLLLSNVADWLPLIEFRLTGAAAATRLVLQSGQGTAHIRQGFGMVDAVVHAAPSSVVHPFFSLSSGVFTVDVSGEAPEPYATHDELTWSAISSVGVGLWARSSKSLAWVVEAQALGAWSKTQVAIHGARVGDLGAPMLFVSTGLVGIL